MKYTTRELRARKRLTQRDVAKAIGISPQTYCEWEKNISKVPIGKVDELAKLFEVGLEEIDF